MPRCTIGVTDLPARSLSAYAGGFDECHDLGFVEQHRPAICEKQVPQHRSTSSANIDAP
jgi:hypothetical protein